MPQTFRGEEKLNHFRHLEYQSKNEISNLALDSAMRLHNIRYANQVDQDQTVIAILVHPAFVASITMDREGPSCRYVVGLPRVQQIS